MVSIKDKFYDAEERLREGLGYGSPEKEERGWEPDFGSISGAVEPAWEERERYERYNKREPKPDEWLIYERKNGEFIGICSDEGSWIYNPSFSQENELLVKPVGEDIAVKIGDYNPSRGVRHYSESIKGSESDEERQTSAVETLEDEAEELIEIGGFKKEIIKIRARELAGQLEKS